MLKFLNIPFRFFLLDLVFRFMPVSVGSLFNILPFTFIVLSHRLIMS